MLTRKRVEREDEEAMVVVAPLSQVSVPGGQLACTTIACVACASRLMLEEAEAELWIRQGAALHVAWCAARGRPDAMESATAASVLEFLTQAWPVRCEEEYGGILWHRESEVGDALEELIYALEVGSACVLTIGAASVALLFGQDGVVELFDSHAQPETGNAVLLRFADRSQLERHLRQRYANSVPFSLARVGLRAPLDTPLAMVDTCEEAVAIAQRMPPGFLYIFREEEDNFVVSGLHEQFDFREQVPPASGPLTFHAQVASEDLCDAVIQGALQLWNDSGRTTAAEGFVVTGSGRFICNALMWFADARELDAFLVRVTSATSVVVERPRYVPPPTSEGCLVSPPALELYHPDLIHQRGRPWAREDPVEPLVPIDLDLEAPRFSDEEGEAQQGPRDSLEMVREEVVRHFGGVVQDTRVSSLAVITFALRPEEGSLVVVEADLKERTFQRAGASQVVPFSDGLNDVLWLPPSDNADNVIAADSSTARAVLGFAVAAYSGNRRRSAPEPPAPGSCPLQFNAQDLVYEVAFPAPSSSCPRCGGSLKLRVTLQKLSIVCDGPQCRRNSDRWDRPSHGRWNLSFLFPRPSPPLAVRAHQGARVDLDRFLSENNMFRALGFDWERALPARALYKVRLAQLAALAQGIAEAEPDRATAVMRRGEVVSKILCTPKMEACYRECLRLSPDFVYDDQLVPDDPSTLAMLLWLHVARKRGFKRVGDHFLMPVTDDQGRMSYRRVAASDALTAVLDFSTTPNLCLHVAWKKLRENVQRLLDDANHFPPLPLSKRYLGFGNAVYDLQRNAVLTWDEARADPTVIPFNCLTELDCPTHDAVQRAAADAPLGGGGGFSHERLDFGGLATPLFNQALADQGFSAPVVMWLYALLGRLFHFVSRQDGDNWELVPFLCGAPSTFKSSIVALVQQLIGGDNCAVVSYHSEKNFPLERMPEKLLAIITECSECDMDRDLFKLLASCDPVRVARKSKDAQNLAAWRLPLLFAGNSFIKNLPDPDGSVERRVVFFAFLRTLRAGQGASDLMVRIFRDEGAALVVKWNIMYQRLRAGIRGRACDALPPALQAARAQAVATGDSLQSFFSQALNVTRLPGDRMEWHDVVKQYRAWCHVNEYRSYSLNLQSSEGQMFLRRLGLHLDPNCGIATVVGVRPRRASDAPVENPFLIREIQRTNSDSLPPFDHQQQRGGGEEDGDSMHEPMWNDC